MKLPALVLALLLALGISLGAFLKPWLPLAALPLLGLGSTLLWIPSYPRFWLFLWPTCLGFFLVSVDLAPHLALEPYRPTSTPEWVQLEGLITLRRSTQVPSPEVYDLLTDRMELPQRKRVVESRGLRFKLRYHGAPLENGRYRVLAHWLPPAKVLNPHQVDWERYQQRRGWHGTLQIQDLELIEPIAPSIASIAHAFAKRCHAWLDHHLVVGLPPSAAAETALILAMILGTFPSDQVELQDTFAHSGTLHLFSVSGLHVAILAWICSRVFKLLPYQKTWGPFATIALCFFYAFLTGWSAASVRAAVMIAVVLLSKQLAMRSSLLNSLGIAALILLIAQPQELFQPGFQLSFAVMLGLGWSSDFGKAILQSRIAPDPFLPRPFLSSQQRWFWSVRTQAAQLGLSSVAALLTSTPLTLYYFNLITPVSLLANFVLIPLSFALLWTGTLSLLSAALGLNTGNLLFNHANVAISHACLRSASFFAALPYAYHYPKTPTTTPRLRILSLPRGEIALHLAYAGQHWLIDVGSANSYPFILKPYLRGEGVHRFENVLISHQDRSHGGALVMVRSQFPINPVPDFTLEGRWKRRLMQSKDRFVRIEELQPHWPTRVADDACSIYRIEVGNHTFFYLADAGFLTESHLLEDFPESWLQCDVVIRGQHRSDLSLTQPLLQALSPQWIVSTHSSQIVGESLSLQNRETCRMMGLPLWDLSDQGCVSFVIEGIFLICEESLARDGLVRRKN